MNIYFIILINLLGLFSCSCPENSLQSVKFDRHRLDINTCKKVIIDRTDELKSTYNIEIDTFFIGLDIKKLIAINKTTPILLYKNFYGNLWYENENSVYDEIVLDLIKLNKCEYTELTQIKWEKDSIIEKAYLAEIDNEQKCILYIKYPKVQDEEK